MNHTTQYRTTLPHQIHNTQCPPLQTFTARFPTLESLNAVMIPAITADETGQYGQIAPFITETRPDEQQQQHIKEQPQQIQQRNNSSECEQNDTNCPTTSGQASTDFVQAICTHDVKNCIQCYSKTQGQQGQSSQTPIRTKIMVDASTMTDNDEMDLTSNWQNVTVPANTKVAEYLTSLRQFLKLSTPGSEGKRKLGDVRIVTSADGSRLYCCPECQMAYPDKSLLEPHLASHKIERRFVCGVCGAGLKRKEHLDRHQLSHTDDRPYSCAACPKTFKRNEHLARHYIIHSGEKAQVCTECGKAFYRKDHLRKHAQGHLARRLRAAAAVVST